jgi:AcrR family transcriptional regulator
MAEACAARGFAATTVTDVVAAAQLTRDDFHALFRDEEECFLATIDFALGEIMGMVSNQYSADKPWFQAVADIFKGLTEFIAEYPAYAKITLLESMPAGSAAVERYNAAKRAIITMLDQGRSDAPADLALPLSIAQIAFGGAEAVIKDELIAGRAKSLPELLPELLYVCYVPFMEQEQAIDLSGIDARRDVSVFAPEEHFALANIELPPASQRVDLMEAMLRVCVNVGYREASVEQVIAEAGVSRDDFYKHFTDKQGCFLATYDFLLDHVAFSVLSAFETEKEWPDQARAGVAALLDWFAAAPKLAHLAIVGMAEAGPAAHRHYRNAVRRFIPLVAAGGRYSPAGYRLPPTVSRLALGSITELLLDEIYAGRAARLSEMVPELTFAVAAPYLGAEEASEVMLRARKN